MQGCTVYFIWKLLYMFRMVPSPIIRSANNCIYSIWYLSHRYCYLPLSWKSWNRFECAVGGVRQTVDVICWKLKRKEWLFPVLINFLRLSLLNLELATWEVVDPELSLCYQFSEGNSYVIIDEWWLSYTWNVRRHAWASICLYSPKCREARFSGLYIGCSVKKIVIQAKSWFGSSEMWCCVVEWLLIDVSKVLTVG